MEIIGSVNDNGQLSEFNTNLLNEKLLSFKGKVVKLTIATFQKKRTLSQNDYYWGVIVQMIRDEFKELGNDLDSNETHEFLRYKFLRINKDLVNNETGEVEAIEFVQSTTKLTTLEFETYTENCRRFAAEVLTLNIPDPTR